MSDEKIEFWAATYVRVMRAIELVGSQAEFARLCGLSPQTFGSFVQLEGERAMTKKTWAKVSPVLDRLVPQTSVTQTSDRQTSGNEPSSPLELSSHSLNRMIAVIDLDEFDFDVEGEAMDKRIEEEALFHLSLPGAKSGRDVLVKTRATVKLRKGLVLPSHLLLVNRSKTPRQGGVAVLSVGRRGYLADVELIDGNIVFVLPTGERLEGFKVFGAVKWHMDDWE